MSSPSQKTPSRRTKTNKQTPAIQPLAPWLMQTTGGRILGSLFLFFLLLGVDLIVTGNKLEAFLGLFGAECLLALLGLWLSSIWLARRQRRVDQSPPPRTPALDKQQGTGD